MSEPMVYCKLEFKTRDVITVIDELFNSYSSKLKEEKNLNFHTKELLSLFNENDTNNQYLLLSYLFKEEIKNKYAIDEIMEDIIDDFIIAGNVNHFFDWSCNKNYLMIINIAFFKSHPVDEIIEAIRYAEHDITDVPFIKELLKKYPNIKPRVSLNEYFDGE